MNSVLVGREAAHGTIAAAFFGIPCAFSAKLEHARKIYEEVRDSQDIHFAARGGRKHESFRVADSQLYHDSFGFWLNSVLGLPVSTVVGGETTVWDSVFKATNDPPSLSLKHAQPRRNTQAFQVLNANVDKLTISFERGGNLVYSLEGVGLPETDIAPPTYTFSSVRPFAEWEGAVTMSGSAAGVFADLLSGKITITRNRKPFHAITGTQSPSKITAGARTVEFDLTVDFDNKDEYDDFRNSLADAFEIVFTDIGASIGVVPSNPKLTLKMGTTEYETAEIDTGPDLAELKLTGKALYNATDASLLVATLRSTRQYQIA